jgi:predicted O-linked N-acetylglucosamine transferase (SPINDLY family)
LANDPASLFAKAVRHFGALQFPDAEAALKKLRARLPNHPDVMHLSGVVAARLGQYPEAARYLAAAEKAKPRVAAIPGELSGALVHLGRYAEAAAAARRAISVDRSLAEARLTLGRALYELGEIDQAVAALEAALRLRPDNADAANDLANTLLFGRHDETAAMAMYERAAALSPRHGKALDGLLFTRMKRCDWRDFDAIAETLESITRAGQPGLDPFRALLVSSSPQIQLAASRTASASQSARKPPAYHHKPREPGSRIRIGYVSGNLQDHPVPYSIVEVIELHDRAQFEVFGYSIQPGDDSAIRRRIEKRSMSSWTRQRGRIGR